MKKIRPLFIALIVVLCVFCAAAAVGCSDKDEIKMFVCTDVHVVSNKTMTAENYPSLEHTEKLRHVSDAIFRSFIDDLIKKKAKYLLITGDLTENGDEESALAVAETLAKAQSKGIKAFVINGNHDVNETKNGKPVKTDRMSKEKFAEIFAPYGYEQAISRYEGTLSYVAELDKTHRLIAVDNVEYKNDDGTIKDGMTEEHRLWIEDRVKECTEQGKTPVVMAHKPLMNHMPQLLEPFMRSAEDGYNKEILSSIAEYGAKVVFVGHMHFNDVKERVFTKDGETNSIYEVMTNCLAMYNTSYREVKLGKKLSVKSVKAEKIKSEYLPEFLPESDRKAIEDDYPGYAEKYLFDYMGRLYAGIADDGGLLGKKLPKSLSKYENAWKIVREDVIKKTITTPYYKKDETDGVSMERTLEKYGLKMPKTDYKNFTAFANSCLAEVIRGDRDFTDEEFAELMKYTVYQVIENLAAAQDKINACLAETGISEKLDLNTEYLYKEGKLECYESNLMPIAAKIGSEAFKEEEDDDDEFIGKVILSLGKDLTTLKNEFVKSLVNGFTGNCIEGYEKYIGDKELDLGGLIEEGLIGTYLREFIAPSEPSNVKFEIELTKEKE